MMLANVLMRSRANLPSDLRGVVAVIGPTDDPVCHLLLEGPRSRFVTGGCEHPDSVLQFRDAPIAALCRGEAPIVSPWHVTGDQALVRRMFVALCPPPPPRRVR
ncbi:MAG: hypothetical protein IT384_16835 [Deltaproteobacteria bacterium]|nr:hypothetical protein [Deltaproteobacteria bacterium]